MRDSACLEHPDLDFFPSNSDTIAIRQLKKVCNKCLVRDDCILFAYNTNQSDGIWGGFTMPEVRKVAPFIRMKEELTRETPVVIDLRPVPTSPKPFVLRVP